VADTRVGDTITEEKRPTEKATCPGFKPASRWCSAASSRSMQADFEDLRDAMGKLR
jgi:GTP-binding protein LepA